MFEYTSIQDVPNDKPVLAKELPEGGYRYQWFNNYFECNRFLIQCPQPMNLYELIRNRKQRVYFDIDIELDEPITQVHLDEWSTQLRTFVHQVKQLLSAHQIAVFTSTYPNIKSKLSSHVVILDKYVINCTQNALIAYFVKHTVRNVIARAIDLKVYKSNQLLRIQNSEKCGSGRPKRLAYTIGVHSVETSNVLYFVQFLHNTAPVDMSIIEPSILHQFDEQNRSFGRYL
jgi:hypothetical protein